MRLRVFDLNISWLIWFTVFYQRAYGKPFLGHSLGISGINTKSAAHNVQTLQRFAGQIELDNKL